MIMSERAEEAGGTLRFFGPFEALYDLALPQTQAMDLYEGFYSGYYDFATRDDAYDVATYQRRAGEFGSPILELGCGSGRLALPLARAGFAVHGIDRSSDMLAVFRKRLEQEPAQVRQRIRTHLADITDFCLDQKFPYIILGALTICLLREAEQRVALFRRVVEHLTPDGHFSFDYLATDEDALREQDDRIIAIPATRGAIKRITFLGRHYYPEEQVQVVNLFSEVVDPSNDTRRYLGSTVKWIVDIATVRTQLVEAGLEIVSEKPLVQAPGDDTDTVMLVTCRPGISTSA